MQGTEGVEINSNRLCVCVWERERDDCHVLWTTTMYLAQYYWENDIQDISEVADEHKLVCVKAEQGRKHRYKINHITFIYF
jgi:hypothetical protein